MDKTADKWLTGIDKHELKGDHFMANDQQQGVFGNRFGLVPRYIIVDKTGKIVLYHAMKLILIKSTKR
jgi:hypothetical protein